MGLMFALLLGNTAATAPIGEAGVTLVSVPMEEGTGDKLGVTSLTDMTELLAEIGLNDKFSLGSMGEGGDGKEVVKLDEGERWGDTMGTMRDDAYFCVTRDVLVDVDGVEMAVANALRRRKVERRRVAFLPRNLSIFFIVCLICCCLRNLALAVFTCF